MDVWGKVKIQKEKVKTGNNRINLFPTLIFSWFKRAGTQARSCKPGFLGLFSTVGAKDFSPLHSRGSGSWILNSNLLYFRLRVPLRRVRVRIPLFTYLPITCPQSLFFCLLPTDFYVIPKGTGVRHKKKITIASHPTSFLPGESV